MVDVAEGFASKQGRDNLPMGGLFRGEPGDMVTAEEYCALRVVEVSDNFDWIAEAGRNKPKREADVARTILERPLGLDEAGEAQHDSNTEGAEAMLKLGIMELGANVLHTYHFTEEELNDVIGFQARDRMSAFSRGLIELPVMANGCLPGCGDESHAERARDAVAAFAETVYGTVADGGEGDALAMATEDRLSEILMLQRDFFNGGAKEDGDACQLADQSCEVDGAQQLQAATDDGDAGAQARFEPNEHWQRPSDYVAHTVRLFEAGETTPPGKKKEPKQITREQLLFLTAFAEAFQAVWEDDRDNVDLAHRRRFDLLLMGQGGSGKTAVVQDIVLPTVDFLFNDGGGRSREVQA